MRTTLFFCATYVAVALLAPGAGHGQPASKLEFEVASIKPTSLDQMKLATQIASGQMPKIGKQVSGARAEYTYMSLSDLIADAYHVKPFQITGPDWLTSQRFDIVAKMPQAGSADDARTMLRALLADRFKLTAHRETKEQPVMALVVAKGGPKLKESSTEVADIDPDAPLQPGERKIQTGEGEARMTIGKDGSSSVNMGKKGIFKTANFLLDSPSMVITGDAQLDLNKNQADGVLHVSPLVALDRTIEQIPVLRSILKEPGQGFLYLSYSVKGPIDDPDITPNVITTIGGKALETLKNILTLPKGVFE